MQRLGGEIMALFLVQHGLSQSKEMDPEQGLSPAGTLDVGQVAKWAREHGLRVARIIHSGKKRALQTAEIFAAALKPEGGVIVQKGLKPLDDPTAFAATLTDTDNLLVVGHLPFMEKLVAHLVTGSMGSPVLKFINGGIVCLDREPEDDRWYIKWAIVPRLV
jgi:phosphohistidine phosphatase